MEERKVVFLDGERLYLRPVEKADLATTKRWVNDPELRRLLNPRFPMDDLAEEQWYEQKPRGYLCTEAVLAIVLKAEDRLIGVIGLHRINWIHRHACTGMLIGEKDFQGQGYGPEAKELLLEYAFNQLNLHRVNSFTFGHNERSQKSLRKSGYREEGRSPEKFFVDGQWQDEIQFGLLARDWRERQARA